MEKRRELSILLVITRGWIGEQVRSVDLCVAKCNSSSCDACRIPADGYLIFNAGQARARPAPAEFDRDIPVPVDSLEDLFPHLRRDLENLLEVSTADHPNGLYSRQGHQSNFQPGERGRRG